MTVSGAPIRYVDWLVPGVIGINILIGSLSGVGFVIVRYRRNGVLKRFKATPLRAFEFVSAQVLSRFFIVAFISVFVFAGTDLFLHFRMAGSWALLALVNAPGDTLHDRPRPRASPQGSKARRSRAAS